jgi:hypothetical protein
MAPIGAYRFKEAEVRKSLVLPLFALSTMACGGSGTSLSGPSNNIPNVAGNYRGTTNLAFPELGESVSCPTTTSVTQSRNTINVAPLVLVGECQGLSIPIGQVTIDATGAIDLGGTSGTYNDPSCGIYNYSGSGGFFGRDFRISLNATSRTCYNFNMTMNLTRQ